MNRKPATALFVAIAVSLVAAGCDDSGEEPDGVITETTFAETVDPVVATFVPDPP